jgi:hypothetical protein
MGAILARLKRQLAEQLDDNSTVDSKSEPVKQ